MLIKSAKLGEVEIPENAVLEFKSGIPGFPDEHSFVFLIFHPESPFSYLQSVTNSELTFMVVDPFVFFKDYNFILEDEVVNDMQFSNECPPAVYCIATVPAKHEEMTANLLAPVLVNWETGQAVQLCMQSDASYHTRHRLFPFGLPKSAGSIDN